MKTHAEKYRGRRYVVGTVFAQTLYEETVPGAVGLPPWPPAPLLYALPPPPPPPPRTFSDSCRFERVRAPRPFRGSVLGSRRGDAAAA